MMTDKKSPVSIRYIFSMTALAVVVILAVGGAAYGQTGQPRPTVSPTPFQPEVISRDTELEDRIEDMTRSDQEDSSEKRQTRDLDQGSASAALALESMTKEEQERLLLYLDILTRLEQRAESLRAQLITMIEKQNSVSTKIQQVDYNLRPEVIAGVTALTGSFRPEDLRDQRKAELEIEKANLENLLRQIETSIVSLENNLARADQMVERVRTAFELVLESALTRQLPN